MLLELLLPVLAAPTLVSEQVKRRTSSAFLPDVQAGQRFDRDPGPPTTPIPWCIWTSPITSVPPGETVGQVGLAHFFEQT